MTVIFIEICSGFLLDFFSNQFSFRLRGFELIAFGNNFFQC